LIPCYVCGKIITPENTSEEHVFINAIGGRLKSKELLCQNCNKILAQLDRALADCFNPITSLLNIKRERGTPPAFPVTSEGEPHLIYKHNGKVQMTRPSANYKLKGSNFSLGISASTQEEARGFLKKVVKDHPEINTRKWRRRFDRKIDKVKVKQKVIGTGKVTLTLPGPDQFRAICKNALNFYVLKTGKRDGFDHLLDYIFEGGDNGIVWQAKPGFIEWEELAADKVHHSILIIGDLKEKLLFAYLEYFEYFKVIVLLDENYSADNLEASYIYDLFENREIKVKYRINIPLKELVSWVKAREPVTWPYAGWDKVYALMRKRGQAS